MKCKVCGYDTDVGYHCCFSELLWSTDCGPVVRQELHRMYLETMNRAHDAEERNKKLEREIELLSELYL